MYSIFVLFGAVKSHGSFKEDVSRVFQRCAQEVSRKFSMRFKEISWCMARITAEGGLVNKEIDSAKIMRAMSTYE